MEKKDVVDCYIPPEGGSEFKGETRLVSVTSYRTEQRIRTATFAVPSDYTDREVEEYLEKTFDWLGLYEIFDQSRFVTSETVFDIVDDPDEPPDGWEWEEIDG